MLKKLKSLLQGGEEEKSQDNLTHHEGERNSRREPRVRLDGGPIQFHRTSDDKPLEIYNLSESGIGLSFAQMQPPPKPGSQLGGRFTIASTEFAVVCEVVHVTDPIVGCRLLNRSEELKHAIKKAFELELRAHNLVKIRPDVLAPRSDGTPYYFQGSHKEELFFVVQDKKIISLNLTFAPHSVEWSHEKGLRAGKIVQLAKLRVTDSSHSNPIDYFDPIPNELLSQARNFINNVDFLSFSHKRDLFEILKNV